MAIVELRLSGGATGEAEVRLHGVEEVPARVRGVFLPEVRPRQRGEDSGLFGAITSKPQDDAIKELAPELKDKKLSYFSPIVKLRQMFNLHTNMRPCKSYPGNPLNYRGTLQGNPSGSDVPIDQVVFRENTEGSYGGVEFFPCPNRYTALCANPKMKPWKDRA
jgi:3-isopropylmalate dehydrogenase